MPIQYRVDSEGGIIEEVWSGTISIRDLHEYWSAYLADPERYGRAVAVVSGGNIDPAILARALAT